MRDHTRRSCAVAAVLACAFAFGPASTPAQRYRGGGGGFGGAGSTVQGDILRGQGIYLMGLGQYNLSSATAASINADTSIRWNQYVYLSIEEDLHKKYLHREARQKRSDASRRKTLHRLLDRPEPADVLRGDALNFVLMQLLDPRISPSNYRKSAVPLPGETIRKIPFHYPAGGSTFSMVRLIGKHDWPLALRGEVFAGARKGYERAIDEAIEQGVEGKLSAGSVRAVRRAVDELSAKVDEAIPETQPDDLRQARNHLRKLGDVPRMLSEGVVERAIAEIETYPGTSVGDLIAFMQRHNLRFGVAESPQEKELYASLYDSLRQQREQVSPPAEPNGDGPTR